LKLWVVYVLGVRRDKFGENKKTGKWDKLGDIYLLAPSLKTASTHSKTLTMRK
jgi:hypothetical protein